MDRSRLNGWSLWAAYVVAIRFGAYVVSSLLAGFAGLILVASVGSFDSGIITEPAESYCSWVRGCIEYCHQVMRYEMHRRRGGHADDSDD